MPKADIVVVLPAHNEQDAIGQVIDSVGYPVVVSASGCTDKTAQIAAQHGAEVLASPKGKGRAVAHALRQIQAKKIVMLDADATYPAQCIGSLLEMLEDYDAAVGIRDLSIQPAIDRWGNAFITRQAQLLYGYPIHDICSGMWAFRGNVARSLNIESYGFTLEAEIFTKVIKGGWRLGWRSIPYYPRIGKKKINRLDHLRIMWYLWSRRFKS